MTIQSCRGIVFTAIIFLSFQSIHPIISDAISDTRYIPQLPRVLLSTDNRFSSFAVDLFAFTGKRMIGADEQEIPFAQLYGEFDLGKIGRAFGKLNQPNPLALINPTWQDGDFIWNVEGKVQGHGIQFFYQQALLPWLSVGASWLFMRTYAHQVFIFKSTNVVLSTPPQSDLKILDATRRQINTMIGLPYNEVCQSGFGDIDFSLRLGNRWSYLYRFASIDAGVRLGMIIPTAPHSDLQSPASVPFGGQKHWGIYGAVDSEFELKEDWKVGVYLRVSKRFEKVEQLRVPIDQEHPLFGLIVIPTRIDPGVTVIFSPYLSFENMREGFGVRLRYTLTHHGRDAFCDTRQNPSVAAQFDVIKKVSAWSSDYVSLSAFYDFGKMKVDRGFSPTVTIAWDLPASLVVAQRVPKTNRVSFGIEFNF